MFKRNKKDSSPASVKPKHRFEQPYENHQSDWRKPQGLYVNDIDAHKRLNKMLSKAVLASQAFSLFCMVLLAVGLSFLFLSGNYENVIFDDGSLLFCTTLKDGSVGIAY